MIPERVMFHGEARWMMAAVMAFAWLVPASAAEKPNIVVVLFDDLGYGQPPSYRGETEFALNQDRMTIGSLLKHEGYATACIGKASRHEVAEPHKARRHARKNSRGPRSEPSRRQYARGRDER